ncbi:uncharacterized protein NECHADRAFT_88450 [Fusarium vanettenii 77-13-4]|uniref:Uncharacterized protein n=1 Tax=Fusarium vanettenii (strain ATCC MYA-4622 / CBS 123669 / FGSC 9596 / NRRL 45880 / 77-13-4) TaxID=660122 RepID=C7ZBJ7_FUSV7|nr:uncharacterized protein NECHADRAFT_88450 [Fusarium vanettenii 77-13-4]EEU38581.1 hypothetical protein NECHADRAFT_88450 [Fusarium vanettenii 77-13-4]
MLRHPLTLGPSPSRNQLDFIECIQQLCMILQHVAAQKKPEDVVDSILRRAELVKIARRLQNLLALAQFKTDHGCEDLSFGVIELAYKEEIRRRPLTEHDLLSHSAAFTAQLPRPSALPSLSHEAGPCLQASGHANARKRALCPSLLEDSPSNPSKGPCPSRAAVTTFNDQSREHSEAGVRSSNISQAYCRRIASVAQCIGNPPPSSAAVPESDDDISTAWLFHATSLQPSLLPRFPPTPFIPLGNGNTVSTTPASHFDWADFINAAPNSPAQNDGKTMSSILSKLPPVTVRKP